ncbi:Hsp70 protein that interacts with Zuo1p [Apophysomyces sp. BC1034]|nr:Hsp70 protein that interacts with Zuo1p [Apophysomyces sp. BC1015]KAG0174488.1 Hsp70 protein that interacts with Zuo1p [Apophysomyces sp. BC1021]KAG0185790.1 Hsp70 protein that interacts with Zuo1p [Apophysomyces sp. BC1034]
MSETNTVIGINFGTSYTSIAYLNKDGRADCLANEEGDRQIASVLAFHGEEEVVGSQAKSDIARHPNATVANFRAVLGKSFADSENLTGSAAPIMNKDNLPAYEITLPEDKKVLTAQEVSAKFLRHIRESAEAFLGTTVNGTVMAVPSYFTEKQREELTQAAETAGLKVIQLVHESAAAALAYGIGQQSSTKDPQDKTIVVCDMGGHSFDVTVLTVRTGIYSVLATAHDTKLGGASFDDLLIDHFVGEFKKKTKVDISGNAKALAKLRGAVEVTKKMLSSANSAPCFVESLAEGLDFHSTINRMRFELLSKKVFAKALEVIREVLAKADLDASEIDEVILVGGAARIPKLTAKMGEVFTSENTHIRASEIEADEVVARGCAIQGSLVAGFDKEDVDASVHPVVTLAPSTQKAIGVINANGDFVTIIPRGTALPARRVFEFNPASADQTHAYLALHEGDHTIEKTEIPAEPVEVEEGEEPIEEEPEIVTKVVIKPAALLIEANLALESKSKIEVQVTVDAQTNLSLVMRQNSKIVKAEVAAKQ